MSTGRAVGRLAVVGTGDVTTRYVLPAIAELHEFDSLPEGLEVVLVSRHEKSSDELRDLIEDSLAERSANTVEAVVAMTRHHFADATSAGEMAPLLDGDEPVAVYLALPPGTFGDAIEALASTGLPDDSRIVFEKPFGSDLDSAIALNEQLARCLPDGDVFRVDHFLGKQTVQQVLGTRFSNRVFEAVWSHEHIESVEIVWDETLALEGRAGFYDSAGALRDMVQNHLVQLFCLVAMEPPESLGHRDVADRKVEVLDATGPFSDDLAACSTRGRYTAGSVDGTSVEGYAESEGVDADLGTETLASITLAVGTERWDGVPFTLRSGKALATDRHEIVVRFRPASRPGLSGESSTPPANVLRFGVDPDRVTLELVMGELDVPDDGDSDTDEDSDGDDDLLATRAASLVETLDDGELGAYSVLLRDVLTGRSTSSVRADEVEASWRVVQPFLDAFAADDIPLVEYPAGSSGP